MILRAGLINVKFFNKVKLDIWVFMTIYFVVQVYEYLCVWWGELAA